jgi:hypothetical protein
MFSLSEKFIYREFSKLSENFYPRTPQKFLAMFPKSSNDEFTGLWSFAAQLEWLVMPM